MFASSIIPETMSYETALSLTIIIAALWVGVVTLMLFFARLTPTQRRDLIQLVNQLHRSSKND